MTSNSGAYTDSTRPGTFYQNYDRRALVAVGQTPSSTGTGWAKIGSTLAGKPLPIEYNGDVLGDEAQNSDIPMQFQGRDLEGPEDREGFFITEADAKRKGLGQEDDEQ